MPYIVQRERKELDHSIDILIDAACGADRTSFHPGKLNYTITRIIHEYIERHGLCYKVINEAIGVLECAKLELYRMIAAPYEDIKHKENGHISELDKEKTDAKDTTSPTSLCITYIDAQIAHALDSIRKETPDSPTRDTKHDEESS